MLKLRTILLASFLLMLTHVTHAEPLGDCSFESTELGNRADVIFCEPLESDTWWSDHDYAADGGLPPMPAVNSSHMSYTSVIDDPACLEGKCLKVNTPQGVTRSLSIHWPLSNAGLQPEELYMRYYFKIGADWTPQQCNDSGATVWPPSGKFWGLADARVNNDPGGQCGNGGAGSDGINCWTARGVFEGCNALDGLSTCNLTPDAIVRIGSYIYVPENGTTHGANGLWDGVAERNTLGSDYTSTCRRDREGNRDPACYCSSENNMYCGVGTGGQLVAEQWYAIETYIKMNTAADDQPANGIIRGWIDDELAYEKTNVRFRYEGHDNLHVRTVWLNTYKGGVEGNCENSELYYDQMVVATERIGILNAPEEDRPESVSDLTVQPNSN